MPYVNCPRCELRTYCVAGERCPRCDAELLPASEPTVGGPDITGVANARRRSAQTVRHSLAIAARELGMDAAVLGEVLSGEEVVRWAAGSTDGFGLAEGVRAPLEETYCRHLLEGRLDAAVPDARSHPLVGRLATTETMRIGAYIGVSLTTDDARLYVLCCLSHERQPALGEREVAFLRGLAESIRHQLNGTPRG